MSVAIGYSCIGIEAHPCIKLCQTTYERRHLRHVGYAVDAYGENVRSKSVQKLHDILSQHIMTIRRRDAETEHNGQLGSNTLGFFYGDASDFYIKDGFDEQGIHATIGKCLYLLGISSMESGSKFHLLSFLLFAYKSTACGTDAANHVAGFVWRTEFVGTLTS